MHTTVHWSINFTFHSDEWLFIGWQFWSFCWFFFLFFCWQSWLGFSGKRSNLSNPTRYEWMTSELYFSEEKKNNWKQIELPFQISRIGFVYLIFDICYAIVINGQHIFHCTKTKHPNCIETITEFCADSKCLELKLVVSDVNITCSLLCYLWVFV